MAMLMMNDIFERTWGERAGGQPDADYWPTVIGAVRRDHPGFVFIAEAYWDLEWALQQQGFDYCYDKRLYDRLAHDDADGGSWPPDGRHRLPVARSSASSRTTTSRGRLRPFPAGRARAAAVTALTQTGARLVHEGQLEGRHGSRAGLPRPPARTSRPTRTSRLLRAAARRARRSGLPRRRVAARRLRAAGRATTTLAEPRRLGLARRRPAPARRRQPRRRSRRPATSRCAGTTSAAARGGSTTRPPASATSEAATTSATGSTSRSAPWAWHLFARHRSPPRRTECRCPADPRRPSTAASPTRRAGPRTTSSPRTPGTSGART